MNPFFYVYSFIKKQVCRKKAAILCVKSVKSVKKKEVKM